MQMLKGRMNCVSTLNCEVRSAYFKVGILITIWNIYFLGFSHIQTVVMQMLGGRAKCASPLSWDDKLLNRWLHIYMSVCFTMLPELLWKWTLKAPDLCLFLSPFFPFQIMQCDLRIKKGCGYNLSSGVICSFIRNGRRWLLEWS